MFTWDFGCVVFSHCFSPVQMIYCHYLLVKLGYETLSLHHFVVLESIKLKIKIKTSWKKSNNAVLLKMCSQDADATEAFLLSFHFKWLSEILWIVVLEGLRAWFNKNNFPSRLSCLPTKQRLKQSIWNAALWSYSCCLGISTWRTTSSAGPRCRIAGQIQPVPPTAPPRLSQQTLYLSHFLP